MHQVRCECLRLGRLTPRHLKRLLDVKSPRIPQGIPAVIIIDAIGQIGALLDLGDEDAGTDRMQSARRDKEYIPGFYRYGV